jgi:hypothetical protein
MARDRDPLDVARSVESLRSFRARKDRDVSLEGELGRLARRYEKSASGLGEVAEAWEALASEELRAVCRLKGYSQGVLTIAVEDASARYRVDRALRGGLRRELIRASRVSLRDVKVRVEASGGDS